MYDRDFKTGEGKANCVTSVGEKGAANETVIEYFNEANFRRFIENPMDTPSGILQKFVEPQAVHNSKILYSGCDL